MDPRVFIQNLYYFYNELYQSVIFDSRPLIRIGSVNDGGYLLPEDLSSIECCFSPGVSDTSDFELDCARIYGMPVYLCDHTVDAPVLNHSLFKFQKMAISYNSNPTPLSQTVSSWVKKSGFGDSGNLLLQMDIEGAEYDFFIYEKRDFLEQFKYIVFEMHYLHMMLTPAYFESRLIPFLRKIREVFNVVHIHPNTTTVFASIGDLKLAHCIEITLSNKLNYHNKTRSTDHGDPSSRELNFYPRHRLDAPNIARGNDLDLPDLIFLKKIIADFQGK